MPIDGARKSCPMCCSEIAAAAKKCPHCHHFQSRAVTLLYHPASAVALMALPFLLMVVVIGRIFAAGEDFAPYSNQIVIEESQVAFGETKSGETVVAMGVVDNRSEISWSEVIFHVEFFDAAGKRTDTEQKRNYAMFVPAREKMPFKISFQREFPKEQYVKHSVKIVSAKDARARW